MHVKGKYVTHHEVYVEVDVKDLIRRLIVDELQRQNLPVILGGQLIRRHEEASPRLPEFYLNWTKSDYGSHYMEWDERVALTEEQFLEMGRLYKLHADMLALIKE